MVECYSGLYEEGEVEYINCQHLPTPRGIIIGGANQRPTKMEAITAYIGTYQHGWWAVQVVTDSS